MAALRPFATDGIVNPPATPDPTTMRLAERFADADALLQALDTGRPGFAAVDVSEQELLLDPADPLPCHPRALCTPRLGYVKKNGYELYFGDAFDNLLAFFARSPQNVANPQALATQRQG